MPRTKEQFNEMKANRVESILSAALFLYATCGDKITIDQIADKADCSHGILYHYFSNVDEVIAKLLSSKIYAKIKENLAKPHNFVFVRDEILRVVEVLNNTTDDKEILYTIVVLNETDKKSFRAYFNKLIERGQKDSEVTGGKPSDITDCLVYLFKGYYLEKLLSKNKKVNPLSIDNVMELIKKKR